MTSCFPSRALSPEMLTLLHNQALLWDIFFSQANVNAQDVCTAPGNARPSHGILGFKAALGRFPRWVDSKSGWSLDSLYRIIASATFELRSWWLRTTRMKAHGARHKKRTTSGWDLPHNLTVIVLSSLVATAMPISRHKVWVPRTRNPRSFLAT